MMKERTPMFDLSCVTPLLLPLFLLCCKVSAGNVFIGSYTKEIGRKKGERDRILANICEPLAMAKTEVTLAHYRVSVQETKHSKVNQ